MGGVVLLAMGARAVVACVGEDPPAVTPEGRDADAPPSPPPPDANASESSAPASDAAGDGDGDATDASAFDAGCMGVAACERVVFATQGTTTGALGGASGADAFCTAEANRPDAHVRVRGREFVAWISVVSADAATRHVHGTGSYIRPDGTVIASSWTVLVSGALAAGITLDQFGGAITGTAWTGTQSDGTRAGTNCVDFAAQAASDIGVLGALGSTTSTWTASINSYCNTDRRLICIEK